MPGVVKGLLATLRTNRHKDRPTPSADLNDLMADTLGGAVAAIVYLFRKNNNSNVLRG